jgi:phospholipid/cholesterol/gamma-HCH transport system substrate-binding protein
MNRETLHILVGAAVIVMAPLMGYAFFSGDARTVSAEGYELKARYNRVDGVSVGTNVLLAGVPVGKVTHLDLDAGALQAVLTFTIQDDVKIPEDTAAVISSDGMLGAKYVRLNVGGSNDMLAPGASFEYVQDSVIVEALLEKVILWAESRREKARGADGGEGGQGK